jgi:hypothetical protein
MRAFIGDQLKLSIKMGDNSAEPVYWNWQEETDLLRKPKISCQNASLAR